MEGHARRLKYPGPRASVSQKFAAPSSAALGLGRTKAAGQPLISQAEYESQLTH